MAPAACVFSPAMAAGCELRGLAAARGAALSIRSASAIYMTELRNLGPCKRLDGLGPFFLLRGR